MLTDETLGYMLSHMKPKQSGLLDNKRDKVKADVTEKEALEIFNEVIEVFKNHNVSYQCACRLSLALNHAFLSGAVELYNQENP